MKSSLIYRKFTDFISDFQKITLWGFDTGGLKTDEDPGDYSIPVRKALFAGLARIAISRNRRIRERSFTIFMGDYGEMFQYFAIGIRHSTFRQVKDILLKSFAKVNGYKYETYDRIPSVPLIPVYRYEHGQVIEYTTEEKLVGQDFIEEYYLSGLEMRYRAYISAEGYDLKQKYIRR